MSTAVIPHLHVRNANEAIDFYVKALGAKLDAKLCLPDGRVMHSSLNFEGALVFVCDEFPEHGGHSPQSLGGTPITVHFQVPNAEERFKRAIEAGCQAQMEFQEMFWGDAYGCVTDPYGHSWSFGTTVRKVSPEELQAVITSMGEGGADCE